MSLIGIASDHGGKILKDKILRYLEAQNFQVKDYGVSPQSQESVDYPDYAAVLSQDVSRGILPRGILVCGSGIGMSIAANRFPGVRAALISDEYSARMGRLHNNANVLCLGERVVNHDRAIEFTRIWLETEFEGSGTRHQKRLDKITHLETTIGLKK